MSLPAWCRAEQVGVMQHTEEEVRGTRSAGEAGVCVGVAAVCGGAVLCLCEEQGGGCVFTHVCTGARPCREFGKHLWVHVEGRCCVSQEGVCVCHEGVCGCAQPPCRPGSALAVLALPWRLPHAGTAGLRWLGHAEGMWGLSCLFQTSQGGGMGELTNFL